MATNDNIQGRKTPVRKTGTATSGSTASRKASSGVKTRPASKSASRSRGQSRAKGRKPAGKVKQIHVGGHVILILCAAVVLICAMPYIGRKVGTKGDRVPSGDYDYCLDISHYQGKIQWDSLKVMTDISHRTIKNITYATDIKPVKYVYIKASEGENMKDKRFDRNWKAAGDCGIWRGAYHFYRTSKDPAVQARNFIATVGEMGPCDLPPVLDIETIHDGFSRKELNRDLLIWLETVEKHYGVKPIIYTSDRFRKDYLGTRITSRYKLWIAHYKVKNPWSDDWVMWQFTDAAVVCGVSGKADLSVVPYNAILN